MTYLRVQLGRRRRSGHTSFVYVVIRTVINIIGAFESKFVSVFFCWWNITIKFLGKKLTYCCLFNNILEPRNNAELGKPLINTEVYLKTRYSVLINMFQIIPNTSPTSAYLNM